MSYTLTWYAVGEVLHLNLKNNLSLDEMMLINHEIMAILDKTQHSLTLLIDVSDLTVGYATVEQLRNTQLYRDHSKLDVIVTVAGNKLNRLITLLVFSLSRARFVQVESAERAHMYMSHRGFSPSSTAANGW